ncbi:uncharacterized protein LOC120335778 [Styela clava]
MFNGGETNDLTEDSEPDFIDVREIKTSSKTMVTTSQTPEICVNNVPVKLLDCDEISQTKRSETGRSSLKSSLTRLKDEEEGRKRTISFDLHDQYSKPDVTVEPSKSDSLRNLFTSSRWSTSESESDSELTEHNLVINQQSDSRDGVTIKMTPLKKESATQRQKSASRVAAMNKSKSLRATRKTSADVIVKRRHSTGDDVIKQATALRDSAIDLISDEENSEVYTAVSLAGTLKRGSQPVRESGIKRKYVIIGAVVGTAVALTIIVILTVLLLQKE